MLIPDDCKQFLTVPDLVDLGYGTRNTVYRDIHEGFIPAVRLARNRIVIPRDELIDVLESRRIAPSAGIASEDVKLEAVM